MSDTNESLQGALKADCPRKDLFEAVQTVGHAVTGRNPLPILSHILIKTEGEFLRLIATDMELGISCRIPGKIEEAGSLTAPSKTLTEVLANLPDSDVALSVDRSHTVRVHCLRSDYKILGLPAEDYPQLPEVRDNASFRVQQAKLREMIRQTLFAVSQDEARPILTGVLLVLEGDSLTFVATDTHRLAVKTAGAAECHGSQTAIIPARALNELSRLLTNAEGFVEVTLSDTQVRFSLPGEDDIQIVSRLIEGQFPNYQRVVPTVCQKRLKIPVGPLLMAVRRASIVARESANRVVLRAEDDRLVLTAESRTVGNATEEIEIEREGDDVMIAFNSRYLQDVLSVLEEEYLTLELSEPLKPGLLRPVPIRISEEEAGEPLPTPDYLCVLMPMQIV